MVSKDFKKSPPPRRRASRNAPPARPWRWFLGGALCGALLVWVAGNPQILPSAVRGAASEAREAVVNKGTGADQKPARPPTRFEFYTLLPEMEVAVPEEELRADPAPPSVATPPPAATGAASAAASAGASYLLQVGSFRRREDAERLRAQLALLGMEANIQTVSIDGHQTWHRVRVGPYARVGSLNAARARLQAEGHRSLVLRIRG